MPKGLYTILHNRLDLRPDMEFDHDILYPEPVTNEKNVRLGFLAQWLLEHAFL